VSTWARTATGDLLLPTNGLGSEAIITDPVQATAIRLQDGLQMVLGNWQLDTSQGLPWQTVLGVKNPSLVAFSNLMRTAILELGAPVVISVTQLSVIFARTLRDLKYAFQAPTNSGAILVGGSNGPNNQSFVVVQ
jgi:hypothetical protein